MNESIEFLKTAAQRKQNSVTETDLSTRSRSGIEYAAAVIYADYLGIRVVGRIPAWVRRLRQYPLAVPEPLREGVDEILEYQGVRLTDQGQLEVIRLYRGAHENQNY